jgi:Raf kinase inhibitor-like YbhB/YbcL family protein
MKGQPRRTNQGTADKGGSFIIVRFRKEASMDRAMTRLAPALALILLASCEARNKNSDQANGATAVENATLTKIPLTSDAFQNGQPIPAQYTCDSDDQTPALKWGEPPAGTKSFALVIDDPDAPKGTFRHWGVFDIPASARSIGGEQKAGKEVSNDFGKPGYGGPCPPQGHGPHHYHFKLFALDVDTLNIGSDAKIVDIENAASKHAIAQGELIGTYERR